MAATPANRDNCHCVKLELLADTFNDMHVSDIFRGLGEEAFRDLLRSISIGKLKTYQLYERIKARLHVQKLNTEALRKVAPASWARVGEGDLEFASELAQAILVSHLDMIVAILG